MDSELTWKKILDTIKEQISAHNYRAWFSQIKVKELTEESLTLSVWSAFIKEQILARYGPMLSKAIEEVTGKALILNFHIDSSLKKPSSDTNLEEEDFFSTSSPLPQTPVISVLNPRYTLDNFVVGATNNLAFAAAQAVVANPGVSYNPLFIYGPSGVGKTHLMQGIGNSLLQKNPRLKLIYASSEKFMNDLVEAIQRKTTGDFRQKYRNCDLFLVDDIQFISGRDATQEAFFHTFNELQGKNSQIIINSDRPPQEIGKLEPRLASRFAGGLMVDIQLPDFDTRMAILKAKLAERKESLPEEILIQIAEGTQSNTRELEGKLIQILQVAKASPGGISNETLKRYINTSPVNNSSTRIDKTRVLPEINQFFNIKLQDLTGPRRQKELVLPRQIAMYILYVDCKLPFEKIGEMLGGRDHTTIMHGVEKIKQVHARDREIQRLVLEVRQKLSG